MSTNQEDINSNEHFCNIASHTSCQSVTKVPNKNNCEEESIDERIHTNELSNSNSLSSYQDNSNNCFDSSSCCCSSLHQSHHVYYSSSSPISPSHIENKLHNNNNSTYYRNPKNDKETTQYDHFLQEEHCILKATINNNDNNNNNNITFPRSMTRNPLDNLLVQKTTLLKQKSCSYCNPITRRAKTVEYYNSKRGHFQKDTTFNTKKLAVENTTTQQQCCHYNTTTNLCKSDNQTNSWCDNTSSSENKEKRVLNLNVHPSLSWLTAVILSIIKTHQNCNFYKKRGYTKCKKFGSTYSCRDKKSRVFFFFNIHLQRLFLSKRFNSVWLQSLHNLGWAYYSRFYFSLLRLYHVSQRQQKLLSKDYCRHLKIPSCCKNIAILISLTSQMHNESLRYDAEMLHTTCSTSNRELVVLASYPLGYKKKKKNCLLAKDMFQRIEEPSCYNNKKNDAAIVIANTNCNNALSSTTFHNNNNNNNTSIIQTETSSLAQSRFSTYEELLVIMRDEIWPFLSLKDICRLTTISLTLFRSYHNGDSLWYSLYERDVRSNLSHHGFKPFSTLKDLEKRYGFISFYNNTNKKDTNEMTTIVERDMIVNSRIQSIISYSNNDGEISLLPSFIKVLSGMNSLQQTPLYYHRYVTSAAPYKESTKASIYDAQTYDSEMTTTTTKGFIYDNFNNVLQELMLIFRNYKKFFLSKEFNFYYNLPLISNYKLLILEEYILLQQEKLEIIDERIRLIDETLSFRQQLLNLQQESNSSIVQLQLGRLLSVRPDRTDELEEIKTKLKPQVELEIENLKISILAIIQRKKIFYKLCEQHQLSSSTTKPQLN